MNAKSSLLSLALCMSANTVFAVELPNITTDKSSWNDKSEHPHFSNIAVRAMLRSDFRLTKLSDLKPNANYTARPAMFQTTGDLGKHLSFAMRYRFDWPYERQLDGLPLGLLMANVTIKPNEHWNIVLGKQMMLNGSWEFDYNPMEVFFYSYGGDYLQAFQTGAAAIWTKGDHMLAYQLTKVTDDNFRLKGYTNGFNNSAYWMGSMFDGVWNTSYSYNLTNAGKGKLLNCFMIGNQIKAGGIKLELDYMHQQAYRYLYSENIETEDDDNYGPQYFSTERTAIAFLEWTLPNKRLSLGIKEAFDYRTSLSRLSTERWTTSAQIRYKLFPKYGLSLHAAYAYRIDKTPREFQEEDFPGVNSNLFLTGFVWDFTQQFKKR